MCAISNRIGAGKQVALHQIEGVYPMPAVIPPVIDNFANWIGENRRAKSKRDALFGVVRRILHIVELDLHNVLYGKPV